MGIFTTDPKLYKRIDEIANIMKKSGISEYSVPIITQLAKEYEGIYDLMELWTEATDSKERKEILKDIVFEIKELEEYYDRINE